MLRTMIGASMVLLAVGCQSAPTTDSAIVIQVGDDGRMQVVSAGNSPEDLALAALMQSALNGELGEEEAEAEPLREDEVWREDTAGNLTHIQSGAQCPARWGEYARERTAIYLPDGSNVGCNYNSADGKILTFYVYESPDSLAEELDTTFEAIKMRQPVSEEAPFGARMRSSGYVARTLAYQQADGTNMRTSVLLADGGPWRLKIRLTCPAADSVRVEEAAGIALIGQADRLNSPPPQPTEARSPV